MLVGECLARLPGTAVHEGAVCIGRRFWRTMCGSLGSILSWQSFGAGEQGYGKCITELNLFHPRCEHSKTGSLLT